MVLLDRHKPAARLNSREVNKYRNYWVDGKLVQIGEVAKLWGINRANANKTIKAAAVKAASGLLGMSPDDFVVSRNGIKVRVTPYHSMVKAADESKEIRKNLGKKYRGYWVNGKLLRIGQVADMWQLRIGQAELAIRATAATAPNPEDFVVSRNNIEVRVTPYPLSAGYSKSIETAKQRAALRKVLPKVGTILYPADKNVPIRWDPELKEMVLLAHLSYNPPYRWQLSTMWRYVDKGLVLIVSFKPSLVAPEFKDLPGLLVHSVEVTKVEGSRVTVEIAATELERRNRKYPSNPDDVANQMDG